MKKVLALLLMLVMIFSVSNTIAMAEETEIPKYKFEFYGDVSFMDYSSNDCFWIGKNNGKEAEEKEHGGTYTTIIYDVEIAGQQGVRVEFTGDPDEYYLVAQCAYNFEKADGLVFDSLLELLLSIYDTPQHTEVSGTFYNIADVYYDVSTSGLAVSKQDEAMICQRFAQWMAIDKNYDRLVLIDLSMMVDKDGQALKCVLRYTLLPEEATTEVTEETTTSITDGL